jgi:hypothetical protein
LLLWVVVAVAVVIQAGHQEMVVPAVVLQGTHIHQAELGLLVRVTVAVIIAHTPVPVEVVQEVLDKISAAPQQPVAMVVLL